jgi:HAD superfamily hydrolase (TIGR01459 family)
MILRHSPIPLMDSVAKLAAGTDAWIVDIWGVMHNGVSVFPKAVTACQKLRQRGGVVVFVTNAPRTAAAVQSQIDGIGVPRDCYDVIVTSGDLTRDLIAPWQRRPLLHVGPDRDKSLFDGLDIAAAPAGTCEVVVCSGLYDDTKETPDDYTTLFTPLARRGVPMICANPDIKVERGRRQVYCAGSIAREYQQMGGRVALAGKPHQPIYDLAKREAEAVLGRAVEASEILAIGDGLLTDVKGAVNCGYDVLYISAGVHAKEYGEHGEPDPEKLTAWLVGHGVAPVATMPMLAW